MEQMMQIFMSLMDAKAHRDASKIQRKEEENRITKCIHII
jgi:hypothetical protein